MALKNHTLSQTAPARRSNTLDDLDDQELLVLRHEIDKRLRIDLTKLNLSDELGMQYRSGMTLLASVQDDDDTPANQRAQVFNSVSSMLASIVKSQESIYSIERLKKFEIAVLKALKSLPEESRLAFFDLYGQYLREGEDAQ